MPELNELYALFGKVLKNRDLHEIVYENLLAWLKYNQKMCNDFAEKSDSRFDDNQKIIPIFRDLMDARLKTDEERVAEILERIGSRVGDDVELAQVLEDIFIIQLEPIYNRRRIEPVSRLRK